jgi:hypothetical protein
MYMTQDNFKKSNSKAASISGPTQSPENRRITGEGAVPNGFAHRWKPGQSGNPGGRPKSGALARACREVMAEVVPGDRKGRTGARAIAERMFEFALKGHLGAIKDMADRAEGRAGEYFNLELHHSPQDGELVDQGKADESDIIIPLNPEDENLK